MKEPGQSGVQCVQNHAAAEQTLGISVSQRWLRMVDSSAILLTPTSNNVYATRRSALWTVRVRGTKSGAAAVRVAALGCSTRRTTCLRRLCSVARSALPTMRRRCSSSATRTNARTHAKVRGLSGLHAPLLVALARRLVRSS